MDEANLSSSSIKKSQEKSRAVLPHKMIDRSNVSIWNILKQCVDKELYKFTLPIIWNEPLSFLQRIAENLYYAPILLNKASKNDNPIERMKLVAAFIISSISIHSERLSKPFNPLLGETYEFQTDDYRLASEQVSHHPPVSAFYAESLDKTWSHYGSVNPNMKLNLSGSIDVIGEGIQSIEFKKYDEIYTWHNVKITAHNLLIGKMWFEYTGEMEIINHKLGIKCYLDFKPYSWFSGNLNKVEGLIKDRNGVVQSLLCGQWNTGLYSCDDPTNSSFYKNHTKKGTCVWESQIKQGDINPDYYNFTKFTMQLNEINDELANRLPKTDSRLRQDMRELENGNIDKASSEKHRLEETQRDRRRTGTNAEILWFTKQSHSQVDDEETWSFNHAYWNNDYSSSLNLFS